VLLSSETENKSKPSTRGKKKKGEEASRLATVKWQFEMTMARFLTRYTLTVRRL
jgi:hypothetical protein